MNPTEDFLAKYITADATEFPRGLEEDIEGIHLMNQHLDAVALGEAKYLESVENFRFKEVK